MLFIVWKWKSKSGSVGQFLVFLGKVFWYFGKVLVLDDGVVLIIGYKQPHTLEMDMSKIQRIYPVWVLLKSGKSVHVELKDWCCCISGIILPRYMEIIKYCKPF